jgi:hypothetical protein
LFHTPALPVPVARELSVAASLVEPAYNDLDGKCTPPSNLAVCARWHEEIRRNFAPREIGMLFGAATSYPEYVTSYSQIRNRHQRLRNDFAANHFQRALSPPNNARRFPLRFFAATKKPRIVRGFF